MAYALAHAVSDHVSYVIHMESAISKSNIFGFENYWVSHPDFLPTVEYFWTLPVHRETIALKISAKLKTLRRGLKAWSRELSKLNKLINNISFCLSYVGWFRRATPTLNH
jgi:hypothetical protein